MDVNLTGQLAANLVQDPIMIASAGALGGLVTGTLTLLGVVITQKRDAEREEKNRKEEARKMQREERKAAYIQFFAVMNSVTTSLQNPNFAPEKCDDIILQIPRCTAEVSLLNHNLSSLIYNICEKYLKSNEKSPDAWNEFFKALKNDVFPLMQAEISILSSEGAGVQIRQWWQFWR